jgi:hypothetical protein
MSQVDLQALVRTVTDRFVDRMASQDMPDADFEENAEILFNFNNIAVTLLKDEPGLEMPGSTQTIPIDEALTNSILDIFSEGICFAMAKCAEMGIIGDPKKNILQDMALEVYNQAKQVIACTYGQESTPGFQFSMDQQIAMINQAAEGHLMYFIGEFEKKFGPIPLASETGETPSLEEETSDYSQATAATDSLPPPLAPSSVPLSSGTPQPSSPASLNEREKYAALALLFSAISSSQRERILNSLSSSGKDWVSYYQDHQRIRQELNVQRVQDCLAHFRDQLQGKRRIEKERQNHDDETEISPILRLTERYDEQKLLSWVQDERSVVIDAIRTCYELQSAPAQHWRQHPSLSPSSKTVSLPPRIEELLARYLARRLDTQSGQTAERHPHAH